MARRTVRACRSVWERRGLRWLAGSAAAVVMAVVVVVVGVSGVSAGPPRDCLSSLTNTRLPVLSPAVSGGVGTVLSTTNGTWKAVCMPLAGYSYQWFRGSAAISGATSSTYTTVSADAGSEITVQVTACNTQDDCATVTAIGLYAVNMTPFGKASFYPVWSHGPVAVNEATGNAVVALPTPSYPTATGSLGFSLTYNSQQTTVASGGLGVGWLLSAGNVSPPSHLHDHGTDSSPTAAAEVDWPDGSAGFYQRVGSSTTYAPLQSDGSLLTKNGDSTWTLIASDGTTYTFAAVDANGNAAVTKATTPAAGGNGQLTYAFDTNSPPRVTSVSYKQTPGSSTSESLTFNWSCGTGVVFCVTGPDSVTWTYSGSSGQITAVNDGTRQLVALTYTSGLVTKIQNADDLDPTHASPGYNSLHSIQLTYASGTYGRQQVACVVDGPISSQAASSQPSCAGGGTASKSTWSFNYAPTCPTLKTPAVSHSYAQGSSVGCTTVTNPNQQPSGPGITVLYDSFLHTLEVYDARLGSGKERTSLVQYNLQRQVAWSEDPDGNPTDYAYDATTNVLTSVTGPTPTGGTSRPVTSYRYDEQTIGTASTPGNALNGLAGSYWNNTTTMTGLPVTRQTDPTPGSGTTTFSLSSWPSAVSGNTSGFSTRWIGYITVPSTGDYTFTTTSHDSTNNANDGTHVEIGSTDLIANMTSPASPASSVGKYYTAGTYPIAVEFAHSHAGTTGANIVLQWACSNCSPAVTTQAIPISNLAPGWENQTSVVTPAGRISFQHFLNQAAGQADYSLVKVGSSNLITSYAYDSLGRMTASYMPKANSSATINSSTGNLTSTPDTNYETDYTYYGDGTTAAPPAACGGGSAVNQWGRLQQRTTSNGGLHSIVLVYNLTGLPIANTNGTGTSCLTYDVESTLTSQTPNGDQSHPISYTYDPNGTALTTANQNGTVTTYYDEAGRLLDTADASGAAAHFAYDQDGNALSRIANTVALSGTTCPSSTDYCTTYSYDAADELTGETDAASHSWSFFYDTRGNLRGTLYPNGTFSWTDVDPAGNTSHVYNRHGTISSTTTTAPSDSNPLADYTYTYVDGSNIYQDGKKLSEARTSSSTTQNTTYTYDSAGRLNQTLLPTGTCRNYSYDLDSNRTLIQESPTGCGGTFTTPAIYTYNPSSTPGTDQLTTITACSNGTCPTGGGAGFTYSAKITVDHTKVPNTDQANFPVLISGTYDGANGTPNLKSAANGGNVQSANGYDIYFYSDAALTTRIPAERAKYVASTGEIEFWVKRDISHTTDTNIYMAYGDPSISTDPNSDATYGKTSVWDSNFKAVYHLPDGSTLNVKDSTSSANDLTNNGATATAGQIDGGASLNGASQDAYSGTSHNYAAATWEAWVYCSDWSLSAGVGRAMMHQSDGSGAHELRLVANSNEFGWLGYGASAYQFNFWTSPVNTNQWYHLVGTYGGTTARLYLNGAQNNSQAQGGAIGNATTGVDIGGYHNLGNFGWFSGRLDEVRISNVARSADWIATEYNNQSSPSTFYSIAGLGPTPGHVAYSYAYTSDGQVSSQSTANYTWDGFGRSATATVGSNTVTYTYDPTSALKSRATNSPSTTMNYLLGDLFETNGSGTITTSYTDGPAGNLASYNGPPTSSSTPTYLYYDAHGNLAAEANTSGTQTANHTYDPFGSPLDSVPTNTTTHRFTGRWNKQYDTTTSLILMGARPYDPATGRFLAVDPIPGGSLNNYDYAAQDPIDNYDLAGTEEETGGEVLGARVAGAEARTVVGSADLTETLEFDVSKLMKYLAKDQKFNSWGMKGLTATKENLAIFEGRLRTFAGRSLKPEGGVELFGGGTFGRKPAMIFYDHFTGKFAAFSLDYRFLGGYRLTASQVGRFLDTGIIGVR